MDQGAVAAAVSAVIDRMSDRSADVIAAIQRRLFDEIVELRGDPQLLDMLRGSVAGNVDTVVDALHYDIAIDRVEPPTAALEYARRLAQRGVPANALVRAYRLGHQEMLAHVLKEIHRADLQPDVALPVFESISAVTFRYIDWISQRVIESYEAERARWVTNQNTMRVVRVQELLGTTEPVGSVYAGPLARGSTPLAEPVDIDAASVAIDYPLRRNHLALVLWSQSSDQPNGALLGLESFLRELAVSMELPDEPLFVAVDRDSGWGWLALRASGADVIEHIRRFSAEFDTPPSVAAGTVQGGLDGFRRSHLQALDARKIALAGQLGEGFTAAGDPGVAIAALLTDDVARARAWVADTLGPLAADTPNDARLRETLRVFLREGSSYKAAAECLNLHHNSVRYRVERAVERRGRPIETDRIDVELALLFCHQLGPEVLVPDQTG